MTSQGARKISSFLRYASYVRRSLPMYS